MVKCDKSLTTNHQPLKYGIIFSVKVLSKDTKEKIQSDREAARQSARIDSEKRERTQQMRHLEVAELKGRRVERFVFIALLALMGALCAFLGWMVLSRRYDDSHRYRPETRSAFESLVSRARVVDKLHISRFSKIDFSLLKNWALIERDRELSSVRQEIESGRETIAETRDLLKALFADVLKTFPPESINERIDAQKLYGEMMGRVDADELRLQNAAAAVKLLDATREYWRYRNGVIEFSRPDVAIKFQFYTQDDDITTARWKKDFSPVVESDVVELPPSIRGGGSVTNPPQVSPAPAARAP